MHIFYGEKIYAKRGVRMTCIEKLQETKIDHQLDEEEHFKLVKQVRRWGDLNTDAILDPFTEFFTVSSIEGGIAYKIHSGHAVVFGEPVCAESDKLQLAIAFKSYCQERKLKVIYILVSNEFRLSASKLCPVAIQIGHKLILDPSISPLDKHGSKAILVRKKVKHAQNEGVTVSEYHGGNEEIEREVQEIGEAWLSARRGPQIYIASLHIFGDRRGKRWFIAKQGERVIGAMVLHELQASKGWLLNTLMATQDAPNGTSELLITSAFSVLAAEGCCCVVVGPVVSGKLQNITGLRSWTVKCMHLAFKVIKKLFRLDGQTHFWDKFQPETQSSYVLFDRMSFGAIKALLKGVNATF